MKNVMLSEWTKIRSVRSTKWSLVLVVALIVGVSGLATGIFTAHWNTLQAGDRSAMQHDTIGLILQPPMTFTQIVICVLSILVITSEFSSGTIGASVLAVPKRHRLALGKLAVLASIVTVITEVCALIAFFIGQAIVSKHVSVAITDPGVVRALAAFALYAMVVVVFSYGLGLLIRHTAGAITAAIISLYVLSNVATLVPGEFGRQLSSLLPASGNSQMVLSTGINEYPYAPWVSMAVFAGWAVAALVSGLVLTARRDV